MITYEIYKPFLTRLASEGVPFMSFDQFNNLVKLYRDDFYAAQYVDMFLNDIGVRYNVWTVDTQNRYYRNVFFNKIVKPVQISFEIPDADSAVTIPLKITMFDEDGVIFIQTQRITVSRFVNGKFRRSSWKKVPEIRDFVLSQARPR